MAIDLEYFEDLAKERDIHEGTKMPHPTDWKGSPRDTVQGIARENIGNSNPLIFPKINTSTGKKYPGNRTREFTAKEKKLAEYILAGYSVRQARLKAGYSGTSDISRPVYDFVSSMRHHIRQSGISDAFLGEKMKEWMGAEKKDLAGNVSPDYKTQLAAYDKVKDALTDESSKVESGKRRIEMTYTDWISNDMDGPGDSADVIEGEEE